MSKFIKLKNIIINTNNIYSIVVNPDKYTIYITGKSFPVLVGVLLYLEVVVFLHLLLKLKYVKINIQMITR